MSLMLDSSNQIGLSPGHVWTVNKAYEFLCSKSSCLTEGPNPENIVLILWAQSILFKRYKEGGYYEFILKFGIHKYFILLNEWTQRKFC